MSDVFLKPIRTALQKFKAGDTVNPSDDLAPHTFEGLKARGFIGSKDVPPASAPSRLAQAVAMKGDDE